MDGCVNPMRLVEYGLRSPDYNVQPARSTVARASEGLAEVGTFHSDDPAHLMQARSHTLADTVAERFSPCGALRAEEFRIAVCVSGLMVRIIRRDNRRSILVIARVEDQAYRVPNPFYWFHRAEFVKHQHFGFEHWAKHFEFSRLH